jgi:hypothetical protein
MKQHEKLYSPALQESLLRMALVIEMAKADGFTDPSTPMQNEQICAIYDHYIACFLRVIRRMIAQGECTLSVVKKQLQ